MSLALSMIVKNGAASLRHCLQSVQGVVDEIVIADTGSSDESMEIAREFGAKLIQIPWEDDFSKAHNLALEPVTSDWVLILDADEELDPDAGTVLPGLMAADDIGGYMVTIRNYLLWRYGQILTGLSKPNDGRMERGRKAASYAEHAGCRLFRRHPGIRFAGRIHESTDQAVIAAGYRLAEATFCIHHFGQLLPAEVTNRKHDYYRELARRKVEEQPDDARAVFELGLEYEGIRDYEAAARCFEHAVELEPRSLGAWMFLCRVYLYLGRNREALQVLEHLQGTRDAEQLREEYRGDALHNLGELKQARQAYLHALKLTGPHTLLTSKLGYVEVRLGMRRVGFRKLEKAVNEMPEVAENYDRLMKALLSAENLPAAADIAEKKALRFPTEQNILRAAAIRRRCGQEVQANELIAAAERLYPCGAGSDLAPAGGGSYTLGDAASARELIGVRGSVS
jgi:tetratricopeptide (TPR) repeat protein